MHIIAGMHRSGTSFLAQAFHVLGADFGPQEGLFAGDVWNQKGYFECIAAVDLNNRMILGDKARVDYWLEAPESGLARLRNSLAARKWKYFLRPGLPGIEARAARYDAEIRAVHDRYRGLYVKDPRFCLTLGAWTARGPVESLVFSFRHPWAVASSIQRREGLPLRFGYQQWLYHVQGFWSRVPRDVPVLLVRFDDFFDSDTQGAAFDRLARHMGHADPQTQRARLSEALDIRLRHHDAAPRDMPADITRAYDALQRLYDGGAADPVTPASRPADMAMLAPDAAA